MNERRQALIDEFIKKHYDDRSQEINYCLQLGLLSVTEITGMSNTFANEIFKRLMLQEKMVSNSENKSVIDMPALRNLGFDIPDAKIVRKKPGALAKIKLPVGWEMVYAEAPVDEYHNFHDGAINFLFFDSKGRRRAYAFYKTGVDNCGGAIYPIERYEIRRKDNADGTMTYMIFDNQQQKNVLTENGPSSESADGYAFNREFVNIYYKLGYHSLDASEFWTE